MGANQCGRDRGWMANGMARPRCGDPAKPDVKCGSDGESRAPRRSSVADRDPRARDRRDRDVSRAAKSARYSSVCVMNVKLQVQLYIYIHMSMTHSLP